MIMADMFPPSSIIRRCVFEFHVQQNHGWHILNATFNSQAVRNSCYSHFIRNAIKADLFPPLPINRRCVFIFNEEHNRGWHVPAAFDSQRVRIPISWAGSSWLTYSFHLWLSGSPYLYFMNITIMADLFLPLLTLSWCVSPFRERNHHGSHLPDIFDYQDVRIYISWAAPWSQLTCSHHFRLSGRAYLYLMSSSHADVLLPLLSFSGCVIPFRKLQHDQSWHVRSTFDSQRVRIPFPFCDLDHHDLHIPAIFDYQEVRIYIPLAAHSRLICSCHFWLSAGA